MAEGRKCRVAYVHPCARRLFKMRYNLSFLFVMPVNVLPWRDFIVLTFDLPPSAPPSLARTYELTLTTNFVACGLAFLLSTTNLSRQIFQWSL
jgi:hypothetical protein